MKELSRKEACDLILGAAILGTGGGGSLEWGREIINSIYDSGKAVKLANREDISKEDYVCSIYACGSVGELSEEKQKEYDRLEKIDCNFTVRAAEGIETFLKRPLGGYLPIELGGVNVAFAMEVAALTDRPLIDADPAGRCVPGMQHTTYALKGIPIYPMGLANTVGDELVLTKTKDDMRVEDIVRHLAMASFNMIGVADHVEKWKIIEKAVIHNTMTMCMEVGQIAQKHIDLNQDYSDAVVKKLKGSIIFRGVVSHSNYEEKDGYTFGDIEIDGCDEYADQNMKIWVQNENIISWKNGQSFVTVPDSINITDTDKYCPLLNPDAKVGMNVTVFAIRAFEDWRTDKGLDYFGPQSFGFDIDYVEMEKVI